MGYNRTCGDCRHYIDGPGGAGECDIFSDLAEDLGMRVPVILDYADADTCKMFDGTQDYADTCSDHDELQRQEPRYTTEVRT